MTTIEAFSRLLSKYGIKQTIAFPNIQVVKFHITKELRLMSFIIQLLSLSDYDYTSCHGRCHLNLILEIYLLP